MGEKNMADFLSMDNILTGDEAANLFLDDVVEDKKETPPAEQKEEKEQETTEDTTEVNPENLFEEEEPESVGSEEDKENNKEQEKDTASKEDGASPKTNFYSSIASALKEEGIFPDLDDKEVEDVKEAEDFRDLIDKQIRAGLDEMQKRVVDALNNGVEPNVIKQYEGTLKYLNTISDEMINDEGERGEQLRRQLLQQDFMNRGYSQERAVKMTEKLFASGEDIEEAKQALQGNKDFFQQKYDAILDEARENEEKNKKAMKKQAE